MSGLDERADKAGEETWSYSRCISKVELPSVANVLV